MSLCKFCKIHNLLFSCLFVGIVLLSMVTEVRAQDSDGLRIGEYRQPLYLCPSLSTTEVEKRIETLIFEPLYITTDKLKTIPLLVEISSVAKDGLSAVLTPREAVFPSLDPVGIEDFLFTLKNLMEMPEGRRPFAAALMGYGVLENGDIELRFKQKQGEGMIRTMLSKIYLISSKDYAEGVSGRACIYPEGTGWYWIPNTNAFESSLGLNRSAVAPQRRNIMDDIRFNMPVFSGIEFSFYPSPVSAVEHLMAGDVDFVPDVPPSLLGNISNLPNISRQGIPSNRRLSIVVNFQNRYLKQKAVREALAYSIDRVTLASDLFSYQDASTAKKRVLGGPYSDNEALHNETVIPREYNISKAKQLLSSVPGVENQQFKLYYVESPVSIFNEIPQQLTIFFSQVGLNVKAVKLSSFNFAKKIKDRHDFDLMLMEWTGDRESGRHVGDLFASSGSLNFGGYDNQNVDGLIGELLYEEDGNNIVTICRQLDSILHKDLPHIFLMEVEMNYAWNNRKLEIYKVHPNNYFGWIYTWSLKNN